LPPTQSETDGGGNSGSVEFSEAADFSAAAVNLSRLPAPADENP
jgi:hypothetical protein